MKHKSRFVKSIFIILFFCLWTPDPGLRTAYAADIKFVVTVDDQVVSLGDSTQLNLNFYGTQDVVAPEIPEMDGFEVRYIGPSSSISIVNRQVSLSITHVYTLVPFEEGIFTIGPFTFEYKGREYTSDPVKIEIVKGPVLSRRRTSRTRERTETYETEEDISGRIFVTMQVPRDRVYVNEIIPMTMKLYVNGMGLKDIQYPKVPHDGFSMGKYEQPRQYRERDYNDNIFDIIEFKTTLFGTRPGKFTLGPAELNAMRITRQRQRGMRSIDDFFGDDLFDDFFGRYQAHPIKLSSKTVDVTVLPFPKEGKPDDFNGTIGDFNFELKAEPRDIRVGDPITLTMKISGNGNFNTVTAPILESQKGFKVYRPTAIEQTRDEKIFEQVIIPKTDEVTQIPKASFSFFNPQREIYQIIAKGLITIRVARPENEEELKIMEFGKGRPRTFVHEKIGRDIIYIKESPGKFKRVGSFLYKKPGYLLLHIIPLLILASLFTIHSRSERMRTDERYARHASAPRKARAGLKEASGFMKQKKSGEFYSAVFKTMQEYLGDRYLLVAGGITANIVDELLKDKGIKKDILDKLERLFADCDMARYAASQFGAKEMEEAFRCLREIIEYMERHRG
ncbi:MAG: BatD family protein [Candidatus Omnitrophota bacterium]